MTHSAEKDVPLVERLARGLFDLDQHKWKGPADWESLRPHYLRDAERFLMPRVLPPGGSDA